MDMSIALILSQDGITNGAIYALLALALVLVFAVTRVIFIQQGEFVAYGALTLAMMQSGVLPATVWLLVAMGALVTVLDGGLALKAGQGRRAAGVAGWNLGYPLVLAAVVGGLAVDALPLALQVLLTLAIVVPILVAAPGYFGGHMTFGTLMMVVGAFNQVQQSLRWFVDNTSAIADWRAALLRVMNFRQALLGLDAVEAGAGLITRAEDEAGGLTLDAVRVETAHGCTRLAVPVKYLATVSLLMPMASNNWAPQYDM